MKKILKSIAIFLSSLLVLMLLIWAYGALVGSRAKSRVEAFCRQVEVGMPLSTLEAQAKEKKLNYRFGPGSDDRNGSMTAWKGVAFYRWFCEVEYREKKVTGKRIRFLD